MVDLPQPDSPTRPRVSPRATDRSIPSTALTAPTLCRSTTPRRDREVLDQVGDRQQRVAGLLAGAGRAGTAAASGLLGHTRLARLGPAAPVASVRDLAGQQFGPLPCAAARGQVAGGLVARRQRRAQRRHLGLAALPPVSSAYAAARMERRSPAAR